ncbi:alkaline phosphatase family protein [Novosphingobium terrae]|uniref:alkaline phosphatase family protein n=1 Tax=Novosphingobium terrae TaxID=2726189 RepID=UPI00389AA539
MTSLGFSFARGFNVRRPGVALLALLATLGGCTQDHPRSTPVAQSAPAPEPTAPPKLVVAISIDQFSADLFAQYRQHFTGGFARLMQGAVFPSAFQSHAATETCPGHSTLLTGAHPSRTGIIANNWFDLDAKRADKRVYCAEDEKDPQSSVEDPVVSAVHLRVPTLGERMKAANLATRNVAVSAKDRAVVMMGGHTIDEGYWWKGGAFTTFRGRELAPAAVAENSTTAALIASGAPELPIPAWCAPRDRAIEAGEAVVGTTRFTVEKKMPDTFRVSPRMDGATLDLAARLTSDMALGKRDATDLLSVSLSATDYIGHAYGSEGVEMCVQMAQLDSQLGAFFNRLDAMGLDYAVMLSADHGGLDTPERLAEQGLPRAGHVDVALAPNRLSQVIAARLNIKSEAPIIRADGPFGDYYISHDLTPNQREKVQDLLVALLKAHPQVAYVFTKEEIARTPLPAANPQDWTMRERARASFDPERTGDVYVMLNRAVVPIIASRPGYTATHGSPYDYDRRVPLLFWRKGLPGMEQPQPVETVDIAPTLAALIGLKVPQGAFDGRCLDVDGGPGNSCVPK